MKEFAAGVAISDDGSTDGISDPDPDSPETHHTELAEEIQRICRAATREERQARYGRRDHLCSKLKSLRASLQSHLSFRPPPQPRLSANRRSVNGQHRSRHNKLARLTDQIAKCERQIISQERGDALRDAS